MPPTDPLVDHLVYATPDVEATVAALAYATGVHAAPGGAHPGRGTRNALLALGPRSYLEIVGPDAAQPAPPGPRWFGIDALTTPRLVTWAAAATDLDELDDARSGSRRTPDGTLLTWRLTDPDAMAGDGLVPFLIDWGDSPHPAAALPSALSLVTLRAEHPDASRVRAMLATLTINIAVDDGPEPALIATLHTPRGTIELR